MKIFINERDKEASESNYVPVHVNLQYYEDGDVVLVMDAENFEYDIPMTLLLGIVEEYKINKGCGGKHAETKQ